MSTVNTGCYKVVRYCSAIRFSGFPFSIQLRRLRLGYLISMVARLWRSAPMKFDYARLLNDNIVNNDSIVNQRGFRSISILRAVWIRSGSLKIEKLSAALIYDDCTHTKSDGAPKSLFFNKLIVRHFVPLALFP